VLGNSPRIFDGTVVGVENPETAFHPQEIPVTMHSPKNKHLVIVKMWIFCVSRCKTKDSLGLEQIRQLLSFSIGILMFKSEP